MYKTNLRFYDHFCKPFSFCHNSVEGDVFLGGETKLIINNVNELNRMTDSKIGEFLKAGHRGAQFGRRKNAINQHFLTDLNAHQTCASLNFIVKF